MRGSGMVGRKGSLMVSQCQVEPMYLHNSMQSVEKRKRLGLSACANLATGTFQLAASITIVPFLGMLIYAPGGTSQFQPLRRYRLGRAMERHKGVRLPSLSTVREGRPPRSSFIGAFNYPLLLLLFHAFLW
jgi:hypothetical protein